MVRTTMVEKTKAEQTQFVIIEKTWMHRYNLARINILKYMGLFRA